MRVLSSTLTETLETGVRFPEYRLYAFDRALDDYAAIITGTYGQTPLDLTAYISDLSWQPSQISFTLMDETGDFHPDVGQYKNYVADGAIIRLLEGDARVAQDHWVWTFTGAVKGQIGWSRGPRGSVMVAKVTAYSRDNTQSFKRRQITSREYTAGTDLGIMFQDLAKTFLGLSEDEILVPVNLGRSFMHKVNQVCQIAPWDALSALLEVVSGVPAFNGEGKLTYWSKNLARAPLRLLPDYVRVYQVETPVRSSDVINKVVVTFLDSTLERVDGSSQCLGQASVTTGFFTPREVLPCYWSDDRKQRADQTWLKIIKSVNANLLPVGQKSYEEIDEYHGEITVTIDVWVPILATSMVAEYLVASFIPDDVVVFLFEGFTISIGRALEAQALVVILLLMMSLGSAQYEIWGIPYDYAYLEKQSIAVQEGIAYWEENQKEIKNDFIGSHDQADAVAVTEWIYEQSLGHPRRVVLDDDLALEIGDVVQVPDGRRIFITNLSKSLKRGELPKLTLDGFKVLRV